MTTERHLHVEKAFPNLLETPSHMGERQGYLSVILLLIEMELNKIRHRLMTKMLFGAGLALIIIVLLQVAIGLGITVRQPVGDFVPPLCSAHPNADYCVNRLPQASEMTQYKHIQIEKGAQNLLPPHSLQFIDEEIVLNIMSVVIVILVGMMVGGEYSHGTIRLLLTRGPTRLQFLVAKIVTTLICIVLLSLCYIVVGVLVAYALSPLSGISPDFSFLSLAWLGRALLYILSTMSAWFVFAMIALFCGTAGRSSVGGVVGGLVWYVVENGLSSLIHTFTDQSSGPLVSFLQAIPHYFVGENTFALVKSQGTLLFHAKPTTIPLWHASGVLVAYLIIFIGLSCWITIRRDITN